MKLLDQVRHVARLRHLALATEDCSARGGEHYIRFHTTAEGFRHPITMRAAQIEQFPKPLAINLLTLRLEASRNARRSRRNGRRHIMVTPPPIGAVRFCVKK